MQVGRCDWRPESVCLCEFLPERPLDIRMTVCILQHPNEESRSLTTVPLLSASLPRDKCIIHRGKRFPPSKYPHLDAILEKPERAILLYPGREAVDLSQLVVDDEYRRTIDTLVVLDGTWRQASSIFNTNPRLHVLQLVKLSVSTTSTYVIRTQPSDNCWSTVESVALALSILESNSDIHKTFELPLKALCDFQLKHGAVVHQSKEATRKEQERQLKQRCEHQIDVRIGGTSATITELSLDT
ncbi:tRNA-uridine aminocarboxypropyltransferase 2-like isoform X2 [Corticium candelabrum]|uniref:tRNA-uridine aminocarboxypropyltransferase 2-like isoform X2 n=1 Tax=Corticium candelabrum TaxID=121492 RepID=UPI002E25A07D|nr:tRNA-uridine aminocarboxypropyltransferase 2-like isoform X2 [Corticium candelabrum]